MTGSTKNSSNVLDFPVSKSRPISLKEICVSISDEINELDALMREQLASRVSLISNVGEYVLQNGGKRLRPILTILCSRLSGYKGRSAIPVGVAIEFSHTASLLHDDVIDNALLRRGRASSNSRWGNHVSVLVGDFFYCRAMDLLVQHGDLDILRAVTDAITKTTEGEILEIAKSNDPTITQDQYLEIITFKTAELIGVASQAGALLAQVSEGFTKALKSFGINIGIAFQLIDDVLDFNASEEEFGKTVGTDLREGKLTLPLILTLQRCSEFEKKRINNVIISESLSSEQFREVSQLIKNYDAMNDTVKLAKNYVQKAKTNLDPFKSSIEKDSLMSIADYVFERKF